MKYIPWFIVFLALYLQWEARAEDSNLLPHLEEVSGDYARFKSDSREPVIYPDTPKERLDLNINMSFLKYGFSSNTVHSLTDDSQFRVVGWKYQIGVHLSYWADIYCEHFSQHILDMAGDRPYPVQNLIGIKVYMYRRNQ